MKGQGGGGTAKGGGKNRSAGQTVKIETSAPRQTKAINDNIVALRAALFEENGKDKDVTKDIAKSFMKFDRNGLDLSIEFATKLSKEEAKWAFDLVKESMEDKYDASGYGWDDEDKMRELTEKGARFLIAREWPSEPGATKGEAVGFAHFRFTVQGEVIDKMAGEPQLYIYDIHIEDHSQRKGLGKHLLTILELIARREKMRMLALPVQLGDNETCEWLLHVGRGWAVDESLYGLGFDADVEGFHVYSKVLGEVKKAAPAPAAAASSTATVFAAPNKVEGAAAAPSSPAPASSVGECKGTEGAAALVGPAATATDDAKKTTAAAAEGEEGGDVVEEGGWLCV